MPEWMMLPEALDPKLTIFLLLVGVILCLDHFSQGHKEPPRVKASARRKRR